MFKWSINFQVEYQCSSAVSMFKCSVNVQVQYQCSSGVSMFKWRIHVQVENPCSSLMYYLARKTGIIPPLTRRTLYHLASSSPSSLNTRQMCPLPS